MVNENEILSPTGVLCVAVPTKELAKTKGFSKFVSVNWCKHCPFYDCNDCYTRKPSCWRDQRTDKTGIVWQPKEN